MNVCIGTKGVEAASPIEGAKHVDRCPSGSRDTLRSCETADGEDRERAMEVGCCVGVGELFKEGGRGGLGKREWCVCSVVEGGGWCVVGWVVCVCVCVCVCV